DDISSPKKENPFCSNHCDEVGLTFLQAPLALEQRANGKETSHTDKIGGPQPSLTMSPGASSESAYSQLSEFEDSVDCSFLNETYVIHYSESKLKNENLTHLNSGFDSDMQEGEEVFFDILEHQGSKTVDLERTHKVSDEKREETAEDKYACGLGEDSQQEYHSAEEQEHSSGCVSLDQTQAVSTSSLEAVGVAGPSYEVACAGQPGGGHEVSGSSCRGSLSLVGVYGQGDSLHVSKFQNSVMLREYRGSEHESCNEQETSSVYHTVFDDIVLRSSPLENQESQSKSDFSNPQKSLKYKICTGKLKPQVTKSKECCGNAVAENKMLQDLEEPSVLPQDKALKTVFQPCSDDCQASCTSLFDDSVICACGYSHCKSLQDAPRQALGFSVTIPRTAVTDNEAVEENSLKVARGNTMSNTCLQSVEGTCVEAVTEAAGRTVAGNQTVDVGLDFRACSTTSRATSARPSVVSTSSNTQITMMNKKRPGEWHSEKQRSVACNTDWPSGSGDGDTPAAATQGALGGLLSADSEKPDGSVQCKVNALTISSEVLPDFMRKERQPPQELEKDLLLSCCERAVQRAARAELQLLDAHYQLCRRRCADIYALVMGDREGLKRNSSSNTAKKELGSALLSVLGDLKVRYLSLKEKIYQGTPLEELPPLSLESKLLSAFSAFVSRLIKEDSRADSELDNQSTSDVDVSSRLKKILSQHAPPKGGGLRGSDTDVDLSPLRLADKECKNCGEMIEDWFDAQENLTGTDPSGVQEGVVGQDRGGPDPEPEMKTAGPLHRDRGRLIHVGGLGPSVSKDDLRSHFQKYHVSEIAIYGSADYRYASLVFKKSNDAKVAVKEMNGMEINGKSVNVRLVKTPGEYSAPLSSKSGSRVVLNDLEKSTSKEINSASSVSRLPRTRPRHLGSEQDSELLPSGQKGVKKNCKQIESAKLLPDIPIQFIPPNTLNLRSFTKIMKRLTELHPEVSRDHIIDALQEVRINHKGFLNGLSINTIVEMTSSVLKNSASS
ncbi:RNA-binding protein 44, partial [Galemys pyrenaicus]